MILDIGMMLEVEYRVHAWVDELDDGLGDCA
jgi:hypothetical protein